MTRLIMVLIVTVSGLFGIGCHDDSARPPGDPSFHPGERDASHPGNDMDRPDATMDRPGR